VTAHGSHVRANQDHWTKTADEYAGVAPARWESEPSWGIWSIPEASVGLLPDVAGLDVVELGCGTAYVSAWLKRRGARCVVGLDATAAQLRTAHAMQERYSLPFPLVRADAELAPFAAESFDVAISEYGAAIWCDPYHWIPEAARLLRPGGRLLFLGNSTALMLCTQDDDRPATDRLLRPQRDMHRFEWPDETGIEFHLGHGEMIRLLRASGFEIEDLFELYPVAGSTTRYPFVDVEWATRWPTEEVWVARKGVSPGSW
jgi:SAM-dependent methyltransferase